MQARRKLWHLAAAATLLASFVVANEQEESGGLFDGSTSGLHARTRRFRMGLQHRGLQALKTVTPDRDPWSSPSPDDLVNLDCALEALVEAFDPSANMTSAPVASYHPNYRTRLTNGTAHPTRE